MNRRHWVMGSVATAAALAGVGAARYFGSPHAPTPQELAAENALWAMRFDQPGGGELALASLKGQPLLLNFWATWCAPCVKELPLIDAFFKQHQAAGWRVVGLAVDSPTPVRSFLGRTPLGFPVGLAGMDGVELARSLGNPSGSLPFTVIFDRNGHAIDRKLGQVEAAELERWAKQAN